MRRHLIAGMGLLAVGAMILAGLNASATAAITNTKHDFSASGWNSNGEICQPCHTPHNGNTTVEAPLWNHALTTATFTPYSNAATLNATVGAPAGISRLCLSCHDGSVALDSFGGATGTTTMLATAAGFVGLDLSNDHPISFTYNAALVTADGELNDPTALPNLTLFGASADQVECATCHDVHDATYGKMLAMSNAGSAMCLECHNK